MGSSQTKDTNIPIDKVVESLKTKVGLLQGEISEIMCMRDDEIQAYNREMMAFAFKEGAWKKERKMLREEVKKLRKKVEDRQVMENGKIGDNRSEKERQLSYLLEQIREEEARKDDAVEKWKQLYFAIKIELDDLIQRTNQGEGLCWKAEEEAMPEELHRELAAKDETIANLQAQLADMKQEECKRQREIDILRQSLRIMCYDKKVNKHR